MSTIEVSQGLEENIIAETPEGVFECPECKSEHTRFLGVSIWSGNCYSKCMDCNVVYKE